MVNEMAVIVHKLSRKYLIHLHLTAPLHFMCVFL